MKKIIALFLICTLLVGAFCGCSFRSESATVESHTEITPDTPAATIELDHYTATIAVGESIHLQATTSTGTTVQWKSSDESVALVNSQGNVTGVAAGVANIICSADDHTEASCTVIVNGGTAAPAPTQAATTSDFIFPHSSTAYLTEAEIAQKLSGMTGYSPGKSYAQDAINEIYARNGYIFKTEEVRTYYQGKSWYTPNSSFSDADLNEYEKHNIKLLQKY